MSATLDRATLIARARAKPVAPYTLDEELTFFCPRENLAGLGLPVVRAFHDWARDTHRPATGEPAILLLLPCQRVKPYTLSAEHRAVNRALLDAGWRPEHAGDPPPDLAGSAPAELLSNAPLRRGVVRIDRAVVSEPFGLVPYEAIYHWRGAFSPAARYDDPGLFEHRGIACAWRADCESHRRAGRAARWGDGERAAYVEVHNRLVEIIATELEAWSSAYRSVLAYVAPTLTHRSFLGAPGERTAAGLPNARTAHGCRLRLDTVAERLPGRVRLIPDAAELAALRRSAPNSDMLTRPDTLVRLRHAIEEAAG